MGHITFPKGFLWGSATAAHQVEGGNFYNDWHLWEQAGNIADQQVSGLACDHYHRFREDIDLLCSLHQDAFRLSIEWSRIEPKRGEINSDEIAHYREVLEYLKEKGVASFVTLHHFTNPTWFNWESEAAAKAFASFAELMAKELGDLVDFWLTINEPNILAKHGWLFGDFPPGKRSMASMFCVLDNMIAGHNQAYDAIHNLIPDAQVGMAKNNGYFKLATDSALDQIVVAMHQEIRNHYFLDQTRFDFIGLNYYSPKKLRFDPTAPDNFFSKKVTSGLPTTDMGWEIDHTGLFQLLVDLHQRYDAPVYITENGLADANDEKRELFIKKHLEAVWNAIEAGVDVRGYLYWSLIDNFEWGFGYGPRFGLIEIDYETQARRIRDSAHVYAQICRDNGFDMD